MENKTDRTFVRLTTTDSRVGRGEATRPDAKTPAAGLDRIAAVRAASIGVTP